MKINQAVLNRVHKYRERRGFKIIDTKSTVYKVFLALYILSFSWFFVINFIFFVGEARVLANPDRAELVYMEPFFILCLSAILTVAGFVLILCRKHLVGGILNLISLSVGTYQFYDLLALRNKDIDSVSKFIWRHLIPAALMVLFCTVLSAIALRVEHLLKRDYNRVLDALYITYKDKLHSGSEEEWEALLTELDDKSLEEELDRQHTAEYLKKKAVKGNKKDKPAEQTDQSEETAESAEQ